MSKYLVVALAAGVSSVSRFRSMKAVKQHVKTAVKANPHDFMVVDNNGNTYVKFVGGKIRKGDPVLYRQFTRRGYVTPAPAPVEDIAASLPANASPEEYKAAQAKWLAQTNLQPGQFVKVKREAYMGEKGWDNSWDEYYMGRYIGRDAIYQYSSGKNGLQLTFECQSFGFPFFVLEVVK